jgi:hypothetical protein
MNPNDNQPISPDYLNQIAPQIPQKAGFPVPIPILIGGLIAVFIAIALMSITSMMASGNTNKTGQLAARLSNTEIIVKAEAGKIRNSQLRAYNSNLTDYLANTIRDIGPLLISEKIDMKKLDVKLVAAETNINKEMLANLEDARLNGVYERTYAREMTYKLDTTLTLMRQIYTSTKHNKLKVFLEDAYNNLEPIQKDFSDFDAANS